MADEKDDSKKSSSGGKKIDKYKMKKYKTAGAEAKSRAQSYQYSQGKAPSFEEVTGGHEFIPRSPQ